MKNLPFFKFDAESWLTGKIQVLPVAEIGIFVNLMARIWKAGGELKNDRFLPRLLGTTPEDFDAAMQDFLELEIITETEGVLRIKFLDDQLAARSAFIRKCSAGGRKSHEVTKKQPPSTPEGTSTNPEVTPAQPPSNTERRKKKEENRKENESVLSPANLERCLGLDNAADFKRWLDLWRDTHGDGRDMPEYQQEQNLRLLCSLPELIRASVLDKAIRGAWKALHDIRDRQPVNRMQQTGTLNTEPQYTRNERGAK